MERKGICENKGVCSLANGNRVQIINDDDAAFVCSECGEELKPYKEEEGKKKNNGGDPPKPIGKLIGIFAAAVLVLGGLGYGSYALYDSHQKSEQEKAELQAKADQQAKELREKEIRDSLDAVERDKIEAATAEEEARQAAIVTKAQAKGDSIIAANEKLLEEKGKKIRDDAKTVINSQLTSLRTACQTLQYENVALIDTMEVAINEAWKNADKPSTGGEGRNPSWGRYEGARQNGLPHGNGILYITRSTTINGQTAQPGERIEGVFRNGYVNMGTWFKKDGNTVVVKDFKVL